MAVIVTPDYLTQPCAELWYDPGQLSLTGCGGFDPAQTGAAVAEATYVLWALSGYRFHGYQCWVEDYRIRAGQCRIRAEQWPVDEFFSVSRVDLCAESVGATGAGDEVSGWCDTGLGTISVCCTQGSFRTNYGMPIPCGCQDGSVIRLHYRTRPNLPPGADRACKRLAEEYVKAMAGQPCNLPERITSITRQGVSWTILDPQDFLVRGHLGIGPLDAWLATVNGRGLVELTDPLIRPHLIASTLVGCGEGCG